MQYSLIDNFRNFAIQHRIMVVSFLCVIILGMFIYLFNVGYASREKTLEFEEIHNLIAELKEKDKEVRNGLEVTKVNKVVKGIDISSWQGNIDFAKVKDSGIDFIMIRCGFRNQVDAEIKEDNNFRYNISEANKYGIPVGVYFYSTARNEEEVLEEASFVINLINEYEVVYPVAYDFEMFNENRTVGVTDATINSNALRFLGYIENHGYTGMLYTNLRGIEKHWDLEAFKSYPLWYAQYADMNSFQGQHEMWQYANNGRVDGIIGNVDLDEGYVAYEKVD